MLYRCCWGTLEADRSGASGTRVEAPALMCGLATVEALSLLQDARPWDTHDVRHGGPKLCGRRVSLLESEGLPVIPNGSSVSCPFTTLQRLPHRFAFCFFICPMLCMDISSSASWLVVFAAIIYLCLRYFMCAKVK